MNAAGRPAVSDGLGVETLILGVTAGAVLAALPVWAGAHLAALLAGRPLQLSLPAAVGVLLRLPHHLGDPAAAFPARTGGALPGAWLLDSCSLAALTGMLAAVLAGLTVWRRVRGGRSGYASARQVKQALSLTAVRARARHARPALRERRPAGTQVGLYLGRDIRSRQQLTGPRRTPTCTSGRRAPAKECT